jgi:hypothetical protein
MKQHADEDEEAIVARLLGTCVRIFKQSFHAVVDPIYCKRKNRSHSEERPRSKTEFSVHLA